LRNRQPSIGPADKDAAGSLGKTRDRDVHARAIDLDCPIVFGCDDNA
jgi:hypothetical protein